MSSLDYAPLAEAAEDRALCDLLTQTFNFPIEGWATFRDRLGRDNVRVVRQRGRVVAGFAFYPLGQWFGGRSVPCAAVAAVGVAPEQRGTGLAAEMMRRHLVEMRRAGVPLVALYASTQRLYRKVGYEQAGHDVWFELPLASVGQHDRALPVEAVDPTAHTAFHDVYRRQAVQSNGMLDRGEAMWQRAADGRGARIFAYAVGEPGDRQGYVIFVHKSQVVSGPYDLEVRDLIATTAAARRRLLALFADHSSIAEKVRWSGPTTDPLLLLLPEQKAQALRDDRWLLRITDLARAFATRGYAPAASGELHLAVDDEVLPENAGRWRVRIAEGSARVEPGGRGEIVIGPRGLGPLYTGYLGARALAACGLLSGPEAALAQAEACLAGPEPWMPDRF